MLTKFAAALLATSMIAGSALAAQPSAAPAANGTAPAVQTQTPSKPAVNATTPAKAVKHSARHRHHVPNTWHAARVMSCTMRAMPSRSRRIKSA